MGLNVINLTCPGCNNRVTADTTVCPMCRGPIVVTSMNFIFKDMQASTLSRCARDYSNAAEQLPDRPDLLLASGLCNLKLRMYDKAFRSFDQLIDENPDESESYYYAAISLLKGKRPFMQPLPVIKKVQEYLDAAIMLEDRGVYHLFQAYVKLDFYAKKRLRVMPDWNEELTAAHQNNLSPLDAELLFDALGMPVPPELSV